MYRFIVTLIGSLIWAISPAQKAETQIHFEFPDLPNQSVVLGYHYHKQMLVKDTIRLDNQGNATYQPAEKLPEGVYVVYLPSQSYFDLLIGNDQTFKVNSVADYAISRTSISGSAESEQFHYFQHYLSTKQQQYKTLADQASTTTNPSERELLQQQANLITQEVKTYWQTEAQKWHGTFLGLFLKGIQEVEIPEQVVDLPTLQADSLRQIKQYRYLRSHFWNGLDFADDRILRTPFFTHKLDEYFTQVLPQIPDTIAREAANVIEQSRPSPQVFKYLVSYLYNMVNESNIMGMDAALVQLAEKYYLSGDAPWADAKFISELQQSVAKIKPTLIGQKAPDLKMVSPDGQYFRLHEVHSAVTILVFWETDCGHCQKEIPQLKQLVWDRYSHKGVRIFAVYTQTNVEEWENFIHTHATEEWINVYDPLNQTGFRLLYHIQSTPLVLVLDKDKIIRAKKIASEQLPGFLDFLLQQHKQFNP